MAIYGDVEYLGALLFARATMTHRDKNLDDTGMVLTNIVYGSERDAALRDAGIISPSQRRLSHEMVTHLTVDNLRRLADLSTLCGALEGDLSQFIAEASQMSVGNESRPRLCRQYLRLTVDYVTIIDSDVMMEDEARGVVAEARGDESATLSVTTCLEAEILAKAAEHVSVDDIVAIYADDKTSDGRDDLSDSQILAFVDMEAIEKMHPVVVPSPEADDVPPLPPSESRAVGESILQEVPAVTTITVDDSATNTIRVGHGLVVLTSAARKRARERPAEEYPSMPYPKRYKMLPSIDSAKVEAPKKRMIEDYFTMWKKRARPRILQPPVE